MAVLKLVVACVLAWLPAVYGMHTVSYALGRPDSTRFVVGVFALIALAIVIGLVELARPRRWAGPLVLPVLGALAMVPLVVVSWPLQYDEDPVEWAVWLAAVGFLVCAVALVARSRRRVLWGSLGGFYVACVLMDVLRG